MLHVIKLLLQPTSSAVPNDVRRSTVGTAPTMKPCRFKGRRGRLVGLDSKVCEALVNYLSPPVPDVDPPPHTLLQLVVDRSGKVETCSVLESSGVPELDARSCSIAIDKARYATTPVTGEMRSRSTRLRIEWPRLPVRAPSPAKASALATATALGPTTLRAAPRPAAAPGHFENRQPLAVEPAGVTYEQRLAAQQGVRGREPTLGWTMGD